MENATKALLIAAAVLIAILLISLGVGVFNTASEQMGNADLTEYEIQKFNDKFEQYVGKNVSASKANALIKTVFNHNAQNEDPLMRVRVGLNGGGKNNGENIADNQKWLVMREQFHERMQIDKLSAGNRYTIEAEYDTQTGLIFEIQIWASGFPRPSE